MSLPVEFMLEAMEELDDLPAIARQITALADLGRVACGQPDPSLLELTVGEKRLIYRCESEQILVLFAESVGPTQH